MTPPAPPSGRRQSPMRQMVLWSLPLATLVALAGGVVAGALRGAEAGWSGLIGGVLGVLVFAAGLFAIRLVLAGPAGMSMAGAFAVLIAQLVVMAMILVLLVQADWVDLPVLAICLVISGLVFQVGVVLGYLRARALLFGADGPGTRPAADDGERA